MSDRVRRHPKRRKTDRPPKRHERGEICVGPGGYDPCPRCKRGMDYGRCYHCPERRKETP